MHLKFLKLNFLYAFINCFNLDTDFPIVYFEPGHKETIDNSSKSYFGYSVVIYPGNITSNQPERIKLGAPKANTTIGSYIYNTGVVYDCPIWGECEAIQLPKSDGRGTEIWKGNFIGGAMDISYKYNRMTICAFRKMYRVVKDFRDDRMMGACYWSSLNENIFRNIDPLLDRDESMATRKINGVGFYYYGQGEAGFSAHFPMEDNELILGAPGIYNWAGSPVRVRDGEFTRPDISRRRRDEEIYPSEMIEVANPDKNEAYGYIGYSVTSGHFYEENKLIYVTGSPRGHVYDGTVLLFEFVEKTIDDPKNIIMNVIEKINGHQFGEYFGASLGSGRIDEDTLDDLIVGAPFHKKNSFNEGRVYVYLGYEGKLREPTILNGNHLNGQFGSAVMFLGDIDDDGFGDVAIGAPYENNESGVVYIYKGSKYGLEKIHSQKIHGKDIMPTMRGFGISISRAVDMDKNGFKDVAIGAHISGNAVLLRSRPVVVIEYDFVSSPTILKHDSQSFLLEVCFRYSVFENETIEILYNMTVDKTLGRAKVDGSNNKTVMDVLTIRKKNQTCVSVAVSLKPSENFNSSATAFPITASISYGLNNPVIKKDTTYISELDEDRLCLRCPVLDIFRSNKTNYEIAIPFKLNCGDDNDCRSSLMIDISIPELSGEPYIVGSRQYLKLKANIKNMGENAYSTKLEIVLPETIFFAKIPPTCQTPNTSAIICSVADPLRENKTKVIDVDLDVNGINKDLYEYELSIFARVFTTSNNTNRDSFIYRMKVKKEADITIYGKSEQKSNSFGSANTEFTHIYKVEKTGVSPLERITLKIKIPHYYMASTAKTPFVQLHEPKATLDNQPGVCQSDFTYISVESANAIGIQDENFSTRRRRQVEVFENTSQIHQNEDIKINDKEVTITSNETFYVNCSSNAVICSEVSCTLGPFNKKNLAVIEIKMIWNISAIMDSIGDKKAVLFSSLGNVEIDIPQNFVQSGNGSDSFIISSIFMNDKIMSTGVALWIIIVAAIVGLLLLLLLVLTLVKVGFFRRAEKQKLEDLKSAHEENHENLDEDQVENSQEELPEPFIMSSSLDGLCDENDQT